MRDGDADTRTDWNVEVAEVPKISAVNAALLLILEFGVYAPGATMGRDTQVSYGFSDRTRNQLKRREGEQILKYSNKTISMQTHA